MRTEAAFVHWFDAYRSAKRAGLRWLLRGRFASFGPGSSFDPVTSTFWGWNRIHIGRGVFIGQQSMVSASAPVSIGDDTVIGPGFYLMAGDHDMSTPGLRYGELSDGPAAPIHIGSNVWIGARVTVLKGVTIGDGAVVGAGSVVTHNIPPMTIAVGVPARVVADRFQGEDRARHQALLDTLRRPPES